MSHRAVFTVMGMYIVVYTCVDWHRDVVCRIGLYRLV